MWYKLKKIMMRPNNVETQVWPPVTPVEEYVMLSEWGDINKFNELTVDWSYQSVFNNTTNWRTWVTQTDRFNPSYKLFSDKEIVWFDVIVQYYAPNNWSSVQWWIVDSANTVWIWLADWRDSYGSSAWYWVRLDATWLSSPYVSWSMTTADVHVVWEKTGDTWTVTWSWWVTFTETWQVNYVCQRMNCWAWMWYTWTTWYIKKVVLYLKPLSS